MTNPGGATEQKSAHAKGVSRIPWSELTHRAQAGLSGFPSNLADQMRKYPYVALGVAVVAGVGVGVVLSSRILRTVIASAASYAAVEVARAYLRERVVQPDGASVVRT
jgi:hypothetical protein